jgi:LysM repeat protein
LPSSAGGLGARSRKRKVGPNTVEALMDRLGILRVWLVVGWAALVVGCADKPAPEVAAAPAPAAASADRATLHVVVQPGQSLDGIALALHVSKRDIIAANNLAPPYSLKAGTTLLIPAAKPVAKTKPAAQPTAAKASAKPVRTARVAAPPPPTKTKTSERGIIPLD